MWPASQERGREGGGGGERERERERENSTSAFFREGILIYVDVLQKSKFSSVQSLQAAAWKETFCLLLDFTMSWTLLGL